MNEPNHGSLDGELLKTLNSLIKRSKNVSAAVWGVLPYLRAVQQKAGGIFDGVFPVLNKLIVWGSDGFHNHPDSIQYVLQLCEVCLGAQPGTKAQEAKNSEAALIYQLMMQSLPAEMGQYLGAIFMSVMLRYNKPITNNSLRIRLLNTVMCGLSIDPQATMNFLASQHATEDRSLLGFVLDETCSLKEDYLHTYDKKIAVFGLCRAIQQESLLPEVVARLKSLFEAVIAILNATGTKSDQQPKSSLDDILGGSDDDELAINIQGTNLFSIGLKTTDDHEFNATMSLFVNPMYDTFDEYDCLRQMLSHLQSVNPEALRVLVAPLPQLRQKQLAELVQKRKVQTSTASARRIVKAKHRDTRHN